MATEIRSTGLVVLSLMRWVFVMEFKMLENVKSMEVYSTSGRSIEEIQSLQYSTGNREYLYELYCPEKAVASRVEIIPYTDSVNEATKLSVVLAEESASVTSIRNGEIEGTCAKVLDPSKSVESVCNSILTKVAFCREGSCNFDRVAPNVSVFLFNDAKDVRGDFIHNVIGYGPIANDEIISVVDGSNVNWDNYCHPVIEKTDSLDVLWYRKMQMEAFGGDTYILVSDRQRSTYEWFLITRGTTPLDVVVSVYDGVALSEIAVNDSFSMELRDLDYERRSFWGRGVV